MEENKKKFALWIHPSAMEKVERLYQLDNCRSRSEFIASAIIVGKRKVQLHIFSLQKHIYRTHNVMLNCNHVYALRVLDGENRTEIFRNGTVN